ncbi:SulP family inorganic anion transporter [Paracoccus sp. (in: a-proteobacteria)]|uniref:SulP family inorganic anion transporter n=1 Tax=Paracoccus sp. TaxID=267 RepID=UPI0026DF5BDE|nr:sulfate permease [Paracoccus sp. (in: a-proteobacteria)]MDO5646460.1 sulfate permease [Paracoccus sp. (in: a-proteobacteria)]
MDMNKTHLARIFPVLDWGRRYTREMLRDDLMAAVIVTIMLIPQSLAYAMLAGLPPQAGIYASIVPIMLYAVFGTSGSLAVGPVAVVSLMTAAAIGQVAQQGTAGYAAAALTLAAMSGGILVLMGVFRLGFLANFLSHPVIAGFITASGILIAVGQMQHILGIHAGGQTLPQMLAGLARGVGQINLITLLIGGAAAAFLFWARQGMKPALRRLGLNDTAAGMIARAAPVAVVAVTTLAVWGLQLTAQGVAVVGPVPASLPPLTIPAASLDLIRALLVPALLISVIGFVESVSVAQTLAARKRQRINPDQELIGLGAANLGAAFTGGYPVTGGFARSVVNDDAGARTPAAGAFTAVGLAVAAVAFTPLVYYLPNATLAATIIVAVLSLVNLSVLRHAWDYSRADFAAVAVTILLTLVLGVETGVSAGVILSVALHLWNTSRPHMAEVGLVPGTQHFRNILRHQVQTDPCLLTIRIDESLYFANARMLGDAVLDRVTASPDIRHVVLMCPAINSIDLSALETLTAMNDQLASMNVTLHLSEVKGPVMDRLRRSHFLDDLTGQVFLSQWDAIAALTPDMCNFCGASKQKITAP